MIRRTGLTQCSGQTATAMMMVEQLGLAIRPWCSRASRGLTSGITSGTSESIRKADELSITTVPLAAAGLANARVVSAPAENRAKSTPAKESLVSSWTVRSVPAYGTRVPADRADANRRRQSAGTRRRARIEHIS